MLSLPTGREAKDKPVRKAKPHRKINNVAKVYKYLQLSLHQADDLASTVKNRSGPDKVRPQRI